MWHKVTRLWAGGVCERAAMCGTQGARQPPKKDTKKGSLQLFERRAAIWLVATFVVAAIWLVATFVAGLTQPAMFYQNMVADVNAT